MTVNQFYEKSIRPLSTTDKIAIARLIINEIDQEASAGELRVRSGFEYLKSRLPHIERIAFTDEELAAVVLNGKPEPKG